MRISTDHFETDKSLLFHSLLHFSSVINEINNLGTVLSAGDLTAKTDMVPVDLHFRRGDRLSTNGLIRVAISAVRKIQNIL